MQVKINNKIYRHQQTNLISLSAFSFAGVFLYCDTCRSPCSTENTTWEPAELDGVLTAELLSKFFAAMLSALQESLDTSFGATVTPDFGFSIPCNTEHLSLLFEVDEKRFNTALLAGKKVLALHAVDFLLLQAKFSVPRDFLNSVVRLLRLFPSGTELLGGTVSLSRFKEERRLTLLLSHISPPFTVTQLFPDMALFARSENETFTIIGR